MSPPSSQQTGLCQTQWVSRTPSLANHLEREPIQGPFPLSGGTRHGLYLFCHTFGDEEVCHFQSQHMAWTISSLLIILAIGVMAIGVSLLVINLKRDLQTFASVGKWVALCGCEYTMYTYS